MRASWIAGVWLLVAAVCMHTASAQEKPDYEKARQHYVTATRALEQGDYTIAAREFGAAYEITKDPILFYKIALAHERAGDCESALVYYGRYLKEAQPTGTEKSDAEERVQACNATVGAPATPPNSDGPGANSTPAGEPGVGGTLAAPPDADDTPETAGPSGGATYGPGSEQPQFLDEDTSSWKSTAGWVSVGVAVAAVTAGAALGLSASSREEDVDNLIDWRDPTTGEPKSFDEVRDQYTDFADEGKNLDRYSKIAFGVAGAAAASAVLFFVLDATTDEPGRDYASLPRRVTPVVAQDSVGIIAGWEF